MGGCEVSKIKGIIFDMDNTILRSKIDFPAMKEDVYRYLVAQNVLSEDYDLHDHITSTIIETAKRTSRLTDEQEAVIWQITEKHERLGMQDADLEPGVSELLERLIGKYRLTIVTNNSTTAAAAALQANDIQRCFDLVVGREMMASIKPAPDGYLYVMDRFPDIGPEEWLAVGDSWIDGKGATAAGIRFISYRGDERAMRDREVDLYGSILDIREILSYL